MSGKEVQMCQSCAMPLINEEIIGTNADNSKNIEYCIDCYKDGAFTSKETMEEFIEICVPYVSKGNPYPNEEAARKAMQKIFPNLKKWKTERT